MNQSCVQCGIIFRKKYLKQKFCSVICSNRKNLNGKIFFEKPKQLTEAHAELFGILLGDGSVTEYFVRIYLNRIADQGYAGNILKLICTIFPGIKATITTRVNRGTEEIQISSKDICNYIRSLGFDSKKRNIPSWITENCSFTKAAIRGLIDTEGCISHKYFKGKNGTYLYKQLTFTNTNKNLLAFVQKGLQECGFSPTKNLQRNIYISNAKDIERYFNEIGTNNPKLVKKLKIK